MNNSTELLLSSLTDFYDQKGNVKDLIEIIEGPSQISLRLIDWFITNYCKRIKDTHPGYKQLKGIYQDYRSQLKAYKKLKFDPFRRRQRIIFNLDADEQSASINTTVGQLNFFKWAIDNGIIKYINENYESLEAAMNTHQRDMKNKQSTVPDLSTSSTNEQDKVAVEELTQSLSNLGTASSTIYFD